MRQMTNVSHSPTRYRRAASLDLLEIEWRRAIVRQIKEHRRHAFRAVAERVLVAARAIAAFAEQGADALDKGHSPVVLDLAISDVSLDVFVGRRRRVG